MKISGKILVQNERYGIVRRYSRQIRQIASIERMITLFTQLFEYVPNRMMLVSLVASGILLSGPDNLMGIGH